MLDYVRWIFDFCTSRYLIMRELRMDKLRVGWGNRARKYEEKVEMGMPGRIAKECWREKHQYGWRDRYGKGREEYYINKNGWGTGAWEITEGRKEEMERELISKERELQRQEEESRIFNQFSLNYREKGN